MCRAASLRVYANLVITMLSSLTLQSGRKVFRNQPRVPGGFHHDRVHDESAQRC